MKEIGLSKRAGRPQRRAALDCIDRKEGYAHLLAPADRAWLSRFVEEYYFADSRRLNAPDALHNAEQRRAIYRDQNAATRDMYSLGRMVLGHPSYDRIAEGRQPNCEPGLAEGVSACVERMIVRSEDFQGWRKAK